jgi:tetratricopeptide (TPR) repeat protein
MNPNEPTLPDELRHKFPQLRVIKHKPILHTINGFGFSVYGQRDWDAETRTYVKTHCFCALFIPLLALGAYRVVEAGPRSWHFIGKEPLSPLARSWNGIVALLAVMLAAHLGWQAHIASPEYKARQNLQAATTSLKEGQPLRAATMYLPLAQGRYYAGESREGLRASVEQCLQSDSPELVEGGLHVLAGLPPQLNQPTPLVPDAFNRGLALVDKFKARDLETALDILKATAAVDPTNAATKPLQIDLLKAAIAAKPGNTNRVVELALVYEADKQLDESVKVLLPYRQELGATEGARILGQYLLQEGKNEGAYGLLFPYVQARLDRLHNIETAYSNTVAAVSDRALAELNANRADRSFYESYKTASKAQKAELVDNYIETRLRSDPAYKRVLAEFKEANEVVPVALDLGIVQLNRAQNLKDAAARKTELEAAEKTFLAIRSFAGDTDEYRLFLGQVYYWLGKSKEGRELFDQLLASRKRAYSILMSLSETLRAVGETADARALAEEAFQTAKSNKEKSIAAMLRALLYKDEDDRIVWLEKADPAALLIQIELNGARGKKALQQGNKTLAADFLRKAIAGYQGQPKSAGSLNNCGLACFDLYEATGNIEDHKRGMALLEEAVAMDPSDSILLHNTTYTLITRAIMDVVRDSINLDVLGERADLRMLAHLYRNEQERGPIYQQLRDSETMKKGLAYLDKALLLAPKSLSLYSLALSVHGGFRDLNELQKLQQRFRVAAPDLTETRAETLKAYQGVNNKDDLEKIQARIRTLEGLLQLPAIQNQTLTLEHVNVSLVELWQTVWICGGNIDSRRLLETALATHQKHQSSASRGALKAAYSFMANEQLAQQNPDYAALVARTRRALAPEYLLVFVLERGGPMADLARKNEYVNRALALQKETVESFPSQVAVTEWASLRTSDPATAAVVAKRFKENETGRLIDELKFQLNPVSATAVLEQYWTQKLLGNEKRAAEIYQTAVHDGVPLPPL